MKSLKQYMESVKIIEDTPQIKKGTILKFSKGNGVVTNIASDLITIKRDWDNKEDDYLEPLLLRGIKAGDIKVIKEAFLIQNKRTDDFIDDKGEWTLIRSFAKKFKSKEDAQKYINDNQVKDDESYMKVIKEATMSDIPHEIDDQIHKLKDMRFDLEETQKNWELAGLDTTPLSNVINGINELIHSMYNNGAKLADQEVVND